MIKIAGRKVNVASMQIATQNKFKLNVVIAEVDALALMDIWRDGGLVEVSLLHPVRMRTQMGADVWNTVPPYRVILVERFSEEQRIRYQLAETFTTPRNPRGQG